ncbi:unnamed protein product [Prunus armeniaca]
MVLMFGVVGVHVVSSLRKNGQLTKTITELLMLFFGEGQLREKGGLSLAGKESGPPMKASLQKTKIREAVVKLRAPVWCRPKALRCSSQLRRVTFAEEVKVGGWCRFPMWDFVQVAAVVTRVMRIRREGVSALVLVVLRLDMLG